MSNPTPSDLTEAVIERVLFDVLSDAAKRTTARSLTFEHDRHWLAKKLALAITAMRAAAPADDGEVERFMDAVLLAYNENEQETFSWLQVEKGIRAALAPRSNTNDQG